MHRVYVLLGNSDRRTNNLIEVAIRDACYEQLHVECLTTNRLDEVLHLGNSDKFGLIFLASHNLVSGPPRRALHCSCADVAEAIRTLKKTRPVCIMGVGVLPQDEPLLLEAGADKVFGILLDRTKLQAEVRRALNLREPVVEAEAGRWSMAAELLRGFQKLRQG